MQALIFTPEQLPRRQVFLIAINELCVSAFRAPSLYLVATFQDRGNADVKRGPFNKPVKDTAPK
jgi:hypothetical protein